MRTELSTGPSVGRRPGGNSTTYKEQPMEFTELLTV
ncbi:hypothetical protein LCGC14_2320740, partial [marine sediment metagenome]